MITTERKSPPDFPFRYHRGNKRVKFWGMNDKVERIGEVIGHKYYWMPIHTNQNGINWQPEKFLTIRVLWEEDEFFQTVQRLERDVEFIDE